MALHARAVGETSAAHRITCDDRWLMAYAAGLGLSDRRHLDPMAPGGLVAHPVFPVAPEWDLLMSGAAEFDYGLEPGEATRGVHAGHDLVVHQAHSAPVDVSITACVAGVEATTAGARLTLLFDAVDAANGSPLWSTWLTSLYRGVDVIGADAPPSGGPVPHPPIGDVPPAATRAIHLPATAAHVYTECARIWNPIHTDTRAARAAGLDGIILHGTATLALGVSAAVEMAGRDIGTVRRLGGSFRAMVALPSTITVELIEPGDVIRFNVRNQSGELAVRDGFVELAR